MVQALINGLIDKALGWRGWSSGRILIGRETALTWRRIAGIAGNRLLVGDQSIVHANINFEDEGGEVRIGSRTFIGRSNLVCYRSVVIGDDVIMSWGITIVDHDSHSVDWEKRRNDVRDWKKSQKNWKQVAHAPVVVRDKAWIGFNVSILKGVTIGEGAVVGACSVVTRDIPPYAVAVGNPARVVRELSASPNLAP
ncbi:acyltransferase [Bradyrhizobium sp. 23]|uniref:acyltransferase n=1 Tax=Bradyrhizobium sp. 23 TaxID=2782667 RepID=UPI0023EEA678|nr:acyltransferase [Bradyrhizobium sp. 23]MCK1313371.1 acyltransferase [Bradyrhizobium sp. 23]